MFRACKQYPGGLSLSTDYGTFRATLKEAESDAAVFLDDSSNHYVSIVDYRSVPHQGSRPTRRVATPEHYDFGRFLLKGLQNPENRLV